MTKMIKYITLFLLLTATLAGESQQVNKTIIDPKLGKEVMIGYCNKTGLEKGPIGTEFSSEFEAYKPQKKYIEKLTSPIDAVEFTIVLGTWCSDSREQVPRFYKILDQTGYNPKRVKVIGVDSNKSAILVDIRDLNIQRVPTFIVYKNGIEVGRIIETPEKKLERDLWNIISETL